MLVDRFTCLSVRSHARPSGFTLLEVMVSLLILSMVGLLVSMTISFSLQSQQQARLQLEAARTAAQIMETLRSTSYDSLDLVTNGSLTVNPLSKFHQEILADLQDRLAREGLAVALTVRLHQGRDDVKHVNLTILDQGLDPDIAPRDAPPGSTVVRLATLVCRRGLNP